MYLRAVHAERDPAALHDFIRTHPLGVLTTAIDASDQSFPFLQSSHIPWVLDAPDTSSSFGHLRGHIARANPQAKAMIAALKAQPQPTKTLPRDVLVLFTAPAAHYVPPLFYTQSKPTTGKVVPTWNYAAVQAYGRATVYHDTADMATDVFLSAQVRELTRSSETRIMGHGEEGSAGAWKVEDAPERYIETLKKAIVGIEIEITDLGGKWKMSQEMGEEDRKGVVQGFSGLGSDVGDEIARMVEERAEVTKSS